MKVPIAFTRWRNKTVRAWRGYSWAVLGGLALVTLVLGYIGFAQQSAAKNLERTPSDNLYLALLLFFFNPAEGPHIGPYLEAARFLSITVASVAVFKTLKLVFNEQYQALKLRCVKNHVVICGLGEKGLLFTQSFCSAGDDTPVVVVEFDENNRFIPTARELGALVCHGDASTGAILKKARVQHAKCLIAVCGADNTNVDIAAQARTLLQAQTQAAQFHTTTLLCIVHLVDDNLRDVLEETFIAEGQSDSCRIEFFNVYDSGARALIDDLIERYPVRKASETSQRTLHVVVLGLGWLGWNVLEKIIANRSRIHGRQLHLTVIGPQAETRIGCWSAALQDRLNLRVQGIHMEVEEFAHAAWLSHIANRAPICIAYVCLEDDNLTLSSALQLHRGRRGQGSTPDQVVACLQNESGLASLLNTNPSSQKIKSALTGGEQSGSDKAELHTFALLGETCNAQLLHRGTGERIAREIHKHFSGDGWRPWHELEPHLQESNRRAADHIGAKLKRIHCSIGALVDHRTASSFRFADGKDGGTNEIEILAKMEHKRWWKEKEQADWSYAVRRDDDQRKHPDCQDWGALSDESRERNRQHIRDLPEILADAGYQIQRMDVPDTTAGASADELTD